LSTENAAQASLEAKLRIIRDCIREVATGFHSGLFLHGPGGTGKSHTIETTLKEVGRPYHVANSRLSGRGLFEMLRDYPDCILLLEDMESLYLEKSAPGFLRSALWGPKGDNGKQERVIHSMTAGRRETVIFSGGIILVSNSPLPETGEWHALKTRINTLEFRPSNDEIAFKMRELAGKGHVHGNLMLSPEACVEVAEEIVSRSQRLQQALDLRLLIKTLQDRMFCECGLAESHWTDLLDARLKERVIVGTRRPETRNEKASRHLTVLRGLAGMPAPDQLEVWKRETGKSKAAFYRWKGRLDAN